MSGFVYDLMDEPDSIHRSLKPIESAVSIAHDRQRGTRSKGVQCLAGLSPNGPCCCPDRGLARSSLRSHNEGTVLQVRLDSKVTGSINQNEATKVAEATGRGVRRLAVRLGEEMNDWFGGKLFSEGGKVSHRWLGV